MSIKRKLFEVVVFIGIFMCLGAIIGYRLGVNRDIGFGVYFENDCLVIDGGRHQGYVFNGNTVDITLPAWIEDTIFSDGDWRNTDVRNFHFDYRNCKPNIIELPGPNRVIVVEGSLHTKTFIDGDPNNGT